MLPNRDLMGVRRLAIAVGVLTALMFTSRWALWLSHNRYGYQYGRDNLFDWIARDPIATLILGVALFIFGWFCVHAAAWVVAGFKLDERRQSDLDARGRRPQIYCACVSGNGEGCHEREAPEGRKYLGEWVNSWPRGTVGIHRECTAGHVWHEYNYTDSCDCSEKSRLPDLNTDLTKPRGL
jgi:hypothetical protein